MGSVHLLVPLVVALPLVMAALVAAAGHHIPTIVPDVVSTLTSAAVTALLVVVTLRSSEQTVVYWFGGWQPEHGVAPGIAFVIDPLAGGLAAFAALATTTALAFAWRYFDDVRHLFHALMLAFLAGLVGFVLSGDLFNMVVFFELMSVCAYALCAYRIDQPSVMQGSVNFAILNSLGSFALFMGVALVYGATGALNLASIGASLPVHAPTGLLVAALTLLTVGFLVKAGTVPFHFWLSDAYAVASAPVGAVFTAIMSEVGLHALARVYLTVFSGAIGYDGEAAVRAALVVLGMASAVIGAVMCLLQADLKRQLAFLTVSNGGVALAATGTLTATGIAGATLYVIAGGALRGALFLAVGMTAARLGASDELWLHGRGRRRGVHLVGGLIVLCALGLAAPPPFGLLGSLSLVYEGVDAVGYGWMVPLVVAVTAVTAGTLLRAAARVFLGYGPERDPLLTSSQPSEPESGESSAGDRRLAHRLWLLAPALILVAVGYGLSLVPDLVPHAVRAATQMLHHGDHARLVLSGEKPRVVPLQGGVAVSWAYGGVSLAGALAVASGGLWWQRLRGAMPRSVERPLVAVINALKSVHSGAVGDYIAWLVVGMAALGVAWGLTLG